VCEVAITALKRLHTRRCSHLNRDEVAGMEGLVGSKSLSLQLREPTIIEAAYSYWASVSL
jgi:hypothetical protein